VGKVLAKAMTALAVIDDLYTRIIPRNSPQAAIKSSEVKEGR
jgi:hypothetical protein